MGKLLILSKYVSWYMELTSTKRESTSTLLIRIGVSSEHVNFGLNPNWLLIMEKKGNFTEKELNEIKKLIADHIEILLKQLDLFYELKPIKAIRK